MAEQRFPLANDIAGNPLDVPEAAVAWRVRRRACRGRPLSVFDPPTGAQLEIDATVDTLRPFADELGLASSSGRTRRARITTRMRSQVVKEEVAA